MLTAQRGTWLTDCALTVPEAKRMARAAVVEVMKRILLMVVLYEVRTQLKSTVVAPVLLDKPEDALSISWYGVFKYLTASE